MNKLTTLRQLGLCLGLAAVASTASAQNATFSGSYVQNFDSMLQTGIAAPTGWTFVNDAGSHDLFTPADDTVTPGVLPNFTAGTLGTATSAVTAVTGPTNQKAATGFNFGLTATPADRSLGTSPTGSAASILQLSLTNSTAAALNSINVNYDIRRFSTTVNNNTSYASGNYGSVEELPGYWLFYSVNGGVWTNVAALNPTLSGSTGVVVPNTVGVTNVPQTTINLISPWAAGGTLKLAWFDDNAQGPSPDQILGLDNVQVAIPEPSTYAAIFGAFALGFAAFRRRSVPSIA